MIFETTVNHKTKHCVTSRVLLASNEENVVLRPNKISLKSHFLKISTSNLGNKFV